ncbi:hypothetical protein ORS3428_27385 [Mesorhizobium sp. ORS 3428]|nr:hypothetical protein ORS3428_27385 [Mesorhizobium sp. ORS 3428]
MTPNGTPVIGWTNIEGLFVAGHGTLGWTIGCGSVRVISDLVGGKKPENDAGDLAISRYA